MMLRAELRVDGVSYLTQSMQASLTVENLATGKQYRSRHIFPNLVFESQFDWIVEKLKRAIVEAAKGEEQDDRA